MEKFGLTAVTVDPDPTQRMRLKQASISIPQFEKMHQLSTLSDCSKFVQGQDPIDIVFLSFRFSHDEVIQFITDSKKSSAFRDAAFVLVLGANDQDSSTIAKNVLLGADGFLFEPYSVENLTEITRLAARVKGERGAARERAAIGFLIKEIGSQLDLLASLRSAGHEAGISVRSFRETCSVLPTLEQTSLHVYYEVAQKFFEDATLPKNLFQKTYSGSSKRVQKMLEEKLLSELKNSLEAEKRAISA